MAGEFDEFLPQNPSEGTSSVQGTFDEFMPNSKIPPTEGLLGSIAKLAQQSFQAIKPANMLSDAMQGKNSFMPPMYGTAVQAKENTIDSITRDNPWASIPLNIVSDPMTIAGGGAALKSIPKTVGNFINPSKAFGKGIDALQKSNPTKKVDFFKVINNALDDPGAKKVLEKSGVIEKYGGQSIEEGGAVSERLSNLSLKESQNLVNDVKSGVKKAIKEGHVNPKEIGIAKMFKELSQAQRKAFEGFKGVQRGYGAAKNVGKFVKKNVGKFVTGSVLGAGAKTGYDLLK